MRLLILLLLVSCSSKEEPQEIPENTALTQIKERGWAACDALNNIACQCTIPGAKKVCSDSTVLRDAVKIHHEMYYSSDATQDMRDNADNQINRFASKCMEQRLELLNMGCAIDDSVGK